MGISNNWATALGQRARELERGKSKKAAGGFYVRFAKPAIDRVGGLILFVLALPATLIAALLIFWKMGRPVFFAQERVGKDGETFRLFKLRTMIPDRRVEQNGYKGPNRRKVHKCREDPRVSPLGSRLRAVRFDELPQFWNVVRGEMSLVGPRPELPEIVADYESWQHDRHLVKPGLTGLWQVAARNGEPMHECTDVDLDYISKMGFRTDLLILLKTPAAMLRRRGY